MIDTKEKINYVYKSIYYIISLKFFLFVIQKIGFIMINNVFGQLTAKIGKHTKIAPSVIIRSPKNVIIGDNCYFNHNTIICGGKNKGIVKIGNNVLTGPNVIIYAYNHEYINKKILIKEQGYIDNNVIIEDDVWIGANSIILPGTIVRRGSVIGAGSIISKETQEYSINIGVKAKPINYRS